MDITNIIYAVPEFVLWSVILVFLVLPLATKNFLDNRVFSYLLLPVISVIGMFWHSEMYWYVVIASVAVVGLLIRSIWSVLSTLMTALVVVVFHVYAAPESLQRDMEARDYDKCLKILHVASVNRNQLMISDENVFERFPDTILSYSPFVDGSIQTINAILKDSLDSKKDVLAAIMNDWQNTMKLGKNPSETDYNQYNNCVCLYNTYVDTIKKHVFDFDSVPLIYKWEHASFDGRLVKGKREGRGMMVYPDSSSYDGMWVNDEKCGKGIYKSAAFVYEGDWGKDKPNGKGIMAWTNGDEYDGTWTDGEKNGKGTMKFADGSLYTGEWKSDSYHGTGTYESRTESYTGDWSCGEKNGKGVIKYSNGSMYNGGWKNNRKAGKGVMKYADGSTYTGEWNDGKRQGRGQLAMANGRTITGQWIDDSCPKPEENEKKSDFSWGKAILGIGAAALMILF